jgi:hypothetical protein
LQDDRRSQGGGLRADRSGVSAADKAVQINIRRRRLRVCCPHEHHDVDLDPETISQKNPGCRCLLFQVKGTVELAKNGKIVKTGTF